MVDETYVWGFFFLWKILAMSSKRKIIRFFISQSNVNSSLNYFLSSHVFLSSCSPRFRCLDFLQVYTIIVFYPSCFFWIYLDTRLQIRCYLKFYQSIWNETKLCHLYVYYDLLIVWNFLYFDIMDTTLSRSWPLSGGSILIQPFWHMVLIQWPLFRISTH